LQEGWKNNEKKKAEKSFFAFFGVKIDTNLKFSYASEITFCKLSDPVFRFSKCLLYTEIFHKNFKDSSSKKLTISLKLLN